MPTGGKRCASPSATVSVSRAQSRVNRAAYRPSARRFKERYSYFRFFTLLKKNYCADNMLGRASETLNRQCSTSDSLSNLEASFGLISRFESPFARRYNYFFSRVSCVSCSNSSIILLFCFPFVFFFINYYLQRTRLSLILHFV